MAGNRSAILARKVPKSFIHLVEREVSSYLLENVCDFVA